MPEIIPDHLHRHALVKQMLSGRMPQRVRASTPGDDAETIQAVSNHASQPTAAEWPERGVKREEQRTLRTLRADLDKVPENGLPDASGQRKEVRATRLGTAHAQCLSLPVDVVQLQAADLAGS